MLSIVPEEGRDYTIEDGLLVFTRGYHLRRGFCCGSICRHCPYGHVAGSSHVLEGGPDAATKASTVLQPE